MNESEWTTAARKALVGKRITDVRWMTDEETEKNGWCRRPIMVIFSDGHWISPQMDDEGNDGGALAATGKCGTWPVLGIGHEKGPLPMSHPNSDNKIPDGILE